MGNTDSVSASENLRLVLHLAYDSHRTATFGLTNGGTAGAIYIYIITFIGFGLAVVSMAEMASMYGSHLSLRSRELMGCEGLQRRADSITGYQR